MSLLDLPDFPLRRDGSVSARFLALGVSRYRAAAARVRDLPYGRPSAPGDDLLVLVEGRGTCSTKHALLARLAAENGAAVELVLGLYAMDAHNTPGVAAVLAAHGLDAIPEAHCYLRHGGARVDCTRRAALRVDPLDCILREQPIGPDQIGTYKIDWHRRHIRAWIESGAAPPGLTLDAAWAIREACIAALASNAAGRALDAGGAKGPAS